MAANYWASTQRRFWLLERDDLDEVRRELEDEQPASVAMLYPVPETRLFNIFIHLELQKLVRRLMARQRALATAQVYIRRFYTKVHPRDTNPYLILVTALYIACKVEECPQHIRLVASESRNIWPDFILAFPPTASTGSGTADIVSRIGECEFWMISELSARLIVHHPFGTMQELKALLELTDADMKVANGIVNDTYASDMCLLFPPYVIAVMAVVMTVMFAPPSRRDAGGVVAQIQTQRQEQKHKEQQQQQQKQGMATWQAIMGAQGRSIMQQQQPQNYPRYTGNRSRYTNTQPPTSQQMTMNPLSLSSQNLNPATGLGMNMGMPMTTNPHSHFPAASGTTSMASSTSASAAAGKQGRPFASQQIANTNMALNMALNKPTYAKLLAEARARQQQQQQQGLSSLNRQNQYPMQPSTTAQHPQSIGGLAGASPIAANLLRDGGLNAFSSMFTGNMPGTTSGGSVSSSASASFMMSNAQFQARHTVNVTYTPSQQTQQQQAALHHQRAAAAAAATTAPHSSPIPLTPSLHTATPTPAPTATPATTVRGTPSTNTPSSSTGTPTGTPAGTLTMPPRMQRLFKFLARDTEIGVEEVAECVQELVSLYTVWEGYDGEAVKGMVGRWVKGQELQR